MSLSRHPQRFRLVAIAAHTNAAKLAQQILAFQPPYAALADETAAGELHALLAGRAPGTRILAGAGALEELVSLPEVHCVMAAIVGAAGLRSTLAAARAGKRLLLANKESLVMAGPLLVAAVNDSGATLLPIDSEHNAIFQCLPPGARTGVAPAGLRRVLLTASGGPFRDTPSEALATVTPAAACAHPNWVMGRKISVDSATLMNKGLELIEACLLFGLTPGQVEILVHPQSLVHSLVEYVDGSVLAQLGAPGHAHADRARAGVARAHRVRCRIPRPAQGREARFPAPGHREVPLSGAGAGRGARRRPVPGAAECSQRGGSTGIPGGPIELSGYCGSH